MISTSSLFAQMAGGRNFSTRTPGMSSRQSEYRPQIGEAGQSNLRPNYLPQSVNRNQGSTYPTRSFSPPSTMLNRPDSGTTTRPNWQNRPSETKPDSGTTTRPTWQNRPSETRPDSGTTTRPTWQNRPSETRPDSGTTTRPNWPNRPGETKPDSGTTTRPTWPNRPGETKPDSGTTTRPTWPNRPGETKPDSGTTTRPNSPNRFPPPLPPNQGYIGKFRPPSSSTIYRVQNQFQGYNKYWTPDWYHRHPGAWCPPHPIPPAYWWGRPSWRETSVWFGVGFLAGVVTDRILNPLPYYYGNNVVYRTGMVYVNDVPLVSADEYYRQAAMLANSNVILQQQEAMLAKSDELIRQQSEMLENSNKMQADQKEVLAQTRSDKSSSDGEGEWLPMGTFTIMEEKNNSENKSDSDSISTGKIIQLATNKLGQICGNLVDDETGNVEPLLGAVDSKTQRVAFRSENDSAVIFECGLWNLTQNTVPLLVHFSEEQVGQYTMIRLTENQDEAADSK
ncbi:MAG: hypothetical protein ACRCUY_11105 [Thermoguttaceae bacterium]